MVFVAHSLFNRKKDYILNLLYLESVISMVYTISEIKKISVPIAKEYGVDSLSLFGSYARGEATSESDVDFFIDKGNIKGLLDFIGFIQDLEEKLKCHVDVVTTAIEDKKFLEMIKKDSVLLYEK